MVTDKMGSGAETAQEEDRAETSTLNEYCSNPNAFRLGETKRAAKIRKAGKSRK